MKSRLPLTTLCLALIGFPLLLGLPDPASAQTFDVGGQGTTPQSTPQKDNPQSSPAPSGPDLGWGSNIEVDRQARAAQDAIKRSDFAAAVNFAQQATHSAPQNPELWFLLGYAARLNDKFQLSIDAYARGLKAQPNNVRGLAGLAQTYIRMGRDQEAQQLLRRVIEASPKDATSLQLAGELMLSADPQQALELLQRAAALQPSAHSDLLIAHAYQRLGQPADSAKYLDRARARAPRDPDVLRAIAGQFREQGNYDQALASLQAIPNKSPDLLAELAYTNQLAGKPQEAAALYSRLAKSARGNIALNLSAAQAMINIGQPDAARPFLDAAKNVDPSHYRLHAIQASLADSEGRLPDAAREYQLAISNLPKVIPEGPLYPVELRLGLYETALRQDDAATAQQTLTGASAAIEQVQPSSAQRPQWLRLRATIESAAGNLDAANRDLKEALSLAPSDVNSLMNYGTLQWKIGQKDAARETFTSVLALDQKNRQALSALGYLARDAGDNQLAENFFNRAVVAHPKDFAPHLALGDLYTAQGNFKSAEGAYENAYQRMHDNPLVVAGGANAALESHNLPLAQRWLDRAQGRMNDSAQVQRERERYLTFKGDYAQSAKLGLQVIEKLPNDREGVVYLAYDFYYLGRLDEAMALVEKYEPVFKNDKDLPLIAGNIHAHNGQLQAALKDFTLALERDPNMATGYANRGFVRNDLKQPARAAEDFQAALRLQPDYGEAHLGLAYANLQLHRPRAALTQLNTAQKKLGPSHALHLARAEAYRQQQDYNHAVAEYRVALSETPNDLTTQLAYADSLYRMKKYPEALVALNTASQLAPTDPAVFALMAQVHARLGNREQAMHDIQLAEQYGATRIDILSATGDALLTLGDNSAAMLRFARALDSPSGDRLGIRLAIAQIFLHQGHADEARRQIAIGFAEVRLEVQQKVRPEVGKEAQQEAQQEVQQNDPGRAPAASVTPDDLSQAANIFLALHDFDLAETYFDKARLAGANHRTVALGLTNTYLAQGNTGKAGQELASLGPAADYREDYDYMMASASLSQQRQDALHALSAFAQASTTAGQQDQGAAESAQYAAALEEGRPITSNISLIPEAGFTPLLEDINVYTLDAKLLGITDPALLPPPRHSFSSLAKSSYRVRIASLPLISGFIGQGMTSGNLLFPSTGVIQQRNTFDTILNGGVTPVLHFGTNSITLNAGLQFTIRRDTSSPVNMNQNLFRQFLYFNTSSFYNWISVHGSAVHESGPFAEQDLHSRDLSANIEFTVGRPWGRTSLITGYSVRDLLFRPQIEEYFNTSTYIGVQHKFGNRLTVAALGEYLRSWRVQNTNYVIAQALLPGGRFEFRANPRWSMQGSFILSRGEGYHSYDNAQSEFLVTYVRPLRGSLQDGMGQVPVSYPMRFSFGLQQQTFYNFPGSSRTTLLPVIHFTIF